MSCLGVPPTWNLKNPNHPIVVAVSKNRASFISMCLRSVHSLLSLRCGGRRSYVIYRPTSTSLRSVHFTHLSTPQQRWLSRSIPQSTQSFHFAYRLYSSHKYFHTQTASKVPFIPQHLFHYTPNPPMPFPNAFPMVYFSYCGVFAPLKRLKAER